MRMAELSIDDWVFPKQRCRFRVVGNQLTMRSSRSRSLTTDVWHSAAFANGFAIFSQILLRASRRLGKR